MTSTYIVNIFRFQSYTKIVFYECSRSYFNYTIIIIIVVLEYKNQIDVLPPLSDSTIFHVIFFTERFESDNNIIWPNKNGIIINKKLLGNSDMVAGFVYSVLSYYIIYIQFSPGRPWTTHSMFRMCGCQVVERVLVIRISGGLSGHVKKGLLSWNERRSYNITYTTPSWWSVGIRLKLNDYKQRKGKKNDPLNRLKTSYYTKNIIKYNLTLSVSVGNTYILDKYNKFIRIRVLL